MKKTIGLTVGLLAILGITTLKINSSNIKAETADYEAIEDITFEPNRKDVSEAAQKVEPLSQEEYDDLISTLPKGAKLASDVEVMPGVVK